MFENQVEDKCVLPIQVLRPPRCQWGRLFRPHESEDQLEIVIIPLASWQSYLRRDIPTEFSYRSRPRWCQYPDMWCRAQ